MWYTDHIIIIHNTMAFKRPAGRDVQVFCSACALYYFFIISSDEYNVHYKRVGV